MQEIRESWGSHGPGLQPAGQRPVAVLVWATLPLDVLHTRRGLSLDARFATRWTVEDDPAWRLKRAKDVAAEEFFFFCTNTPRIGRGAHAWPNPEVFQAIYKDGHCSSRFSLSLHSLSIIMSLSSLEKQVVEPDLDDIEKVARAQQKLEHGYTRWQAIKLYPRAALYILILVWGMITVGFENQASGIVLSIPTFRKDFGHYYEGAYVLEGKWQSAISGGPYGAFVVGSFLGSYLADRFGRKFLIWGTTAFTFVFIGLEYAATSIEVFFIGKFLNGLCLGIIQTVGTTYVAELTPLALRGMSTVSVNLAFCIGPFVCYLIANKTSTRADRWAYRAIFCSQWGFAGIAVLIFGFLPESPYHYVMRNKDEKALGALRKIYPDAGMAESQLLIIKANIEEARILSKSGSYLELFNRKNWRRTLLGTSVFIMQPMSGLAYVASYQTYYYQQAGWDTLKSFHVSCVAQALSVSGTILAIFMVDRFGRRFVTLYGIIALAILNVLTAGLGTSKKQSLLSASSIILTMYNFFYNSGIGPIAYSINSEIPTSQLRVKTIAVGLSLNNGLLCMWSFVLPYMFNVDQADMGSKINFIFAGCCFFSLYFFYFYLPETANRSYEEVDEMFKANVPARKWRSYVTSERTEAESVYAEQAKGETAHIENS